MRRVLVSGSADYAMPAVVSWVFETEGQRADVTVADVCQTPLRLCQWYANHTHRSFKCVASDIMEQAVGEPYDIICTHSFLGSFSADNRKQLVMKWQRLLPPGGAVVSVNRLRPDTVQAVGFNDTQARQFRERLAAAARAYPSDLGISATELASLADGYLRQRSIFPIRSTEEIQDLFADNGFRVAVMESGPITLAPGSVVGGPTLRDAAPYARFVAIRQ